MKITNLKRFSMAMGASLLATIAWLPQSRGELVYENETAPAVAETAPVAASQPVVNQVEDRATLREAIGSSQKMQTTLQAERQIQVQVAVPAAAPAAAVETQTLSKAELMRRERTREELKNEDILQERLEELRLRDERARLNQVIADGGTAEAPAKAAAPQQAVLKEEIVVTPGSAAMNAIDSKSSTGSANGAAVSQASAVTTTETSSDRMHISVLPRGGLSNMVGQSGYFDVRPRFAAGVAARLGATDHFSFEVGYTYNEYGIAMATTNPWVAMLQSQAMYMGSQSSFESVVMKQNVFDAGMKVHLLGQDSMIRPFVGAGGAYSKGFINFDQRVLSYMNSIYNRNVSPDYDVSSFSGYLSGGTDVKVAKNISVGLEFKYYAVLTARENTNFNNYYGAMYGYGNALMGGGYYGGLNPYAPNDTAVAGGSLARSSFYSILGNVTFTF